MNPSRTSEVFASLRLQGDFDLLKSVDGGENWTSLRQNISSGQDVNWISIPETDPNSIAISLWGNGILISSNSGSTWTKILSSSYSRSVEVAGDDASKIFAGIGGNNTAESGLYKTTDKGGTWVKVPALGNKNNAQIHIDRNNTNRIFADADPNFYRSLDGGSNWTVLPLMNAYSIGTVIDRDDQNTIYTGSWGSLSGPFKSTDNGDSWELKNSGFGFGYVYAIDQDSAGNLYVTRRGGSGGLWKSSDKAITWENISDPAWGNRNTWGLDIGGERIFVAVEGLGIYYADLTPVPLTPNPVVIIPGFGGSWSYKGLVENQPTNNSDWQLLPLFTENIYGPIISSFQNAGFTKDANLFVFPYDFRKSITDSAQSLKLFIDEEVVPKNPDKKTDVVAHSMGGLVVRQCVEKVVDCSDRIGKVVTGGSPHQGTLKAYKLWEGGVVDDSNVLTRTIEEIAINALNPFFLTRKDIIQNRFPGVSDFLPIFDYITGKPYESMSPQAKNQNLSSLFPITGTFTNSLLSLSGNGEQTDTEYLTQNPSWWETSLGLWTDGKPVSSITGDGDGTVLNKSSEIVGAVNNTYPIEHVDYFRDQTSINDIFSYLGLPAPAPVGIPSLITSVAAFVIHSPATISVTDQNGNSVGQGDLGKVIFVQNPTSTVYDVSIQGTGTGNYLLETFYSTYDKTLRNTFYGSIKPGEVKTVEFKPSTSNQPPQLNETSYLDLYHSIITRLSLVDRTDRIISKIRFSIEGPWWKRWAEHDDETERERFDDFRENLKFAILLSTYRDVGKILAKETHSSQREILKEVETDLTRLMLLANPDMKVSKARLEQKISLLNKRFEKTKKSSNLAVNLNFLLAKELLEQTREAFADGELKQAYLLTFLISILT